MRKLRRPERSHGPLRKVLEAVPAALALSAILLLGVWVSLHPRKGVDSPGWGPEWDCAGASTKGGGFCVRNDLGTDKQVR